MLKLSRSGLTNEQTWNQAGISLPAFDVNKMIDASISAPKWVHFGAGNIFRGFVAALQQTLLDGKMATTGIAAVEAFDTEIIEKVYKPYDNLSLLVILNPDGTLDKKVIASVSEGLVADVNQEHDWQRLQEIFKSPALQMASFTITEKGYNLRSMSGEYLNVINDDMSKGPQSPIHIISMITALAYTRYQSGELPISFVSMDNCSQNGEKLFNAVKQIAQRWLENGFVAQGFLDYLSDPKCVSFPWSMIDKITPRPSETVQAALQKDGFTDTELICTAKNTYIAPFVNAEGPQYLVIEESFPNGRPPLHKAGVLFADRDTVNKFEKMKVCTCLNPLHTALAVYGCLLGYTSIASEMQDECLLKLVQKIGYAEGLPVVVNPGIVSPKEFLDEVIEKRFPNPFIPDTPQRIATDTSQKMGIRFGETIKAYRDSNTLNTDDLFYIPLAIAGWCRYLMGVDDKGNEMPLSPDPMLDLLKQHLSLVQLGAQSTNGECLAPILSNENIFGVNLYDVGLGKRIESLFSQMVSGKNAVRAVLEKYLP